MTRSATIRVGLVNSGIRIPTGSWCCWRVLRNRLASTCRCLRLGGCGCRPSACGCPPSTAPSAQPASWWLGPGNDEKVNSASLGTQMLTGLRSRLSRSDQPWPAGRCARGRPEGKALGQAVVALQARIDTFCTRRRPTTPTVGRSNMSPPRRITCSPSSSFQVGGHELGGQAGATRHDL